MVKDDVAYLRGVLVLLKVLARGFRVKPGMTKEFVTK